VGHGLAPNGKAGHCATAKNLGGKRRLIAFWTAGMTRRNPGHYSSEIGFSLVEIAYSATRRLYRKHWRHKEPWFFMFIIKPRRSTLHWCISKLFKLLPMLVFFRAGQSGSK
jgi:hypothetical protein